MTAIANAIIEKVYEGPSGVSKVGPWQIYNFKVEGRDEKFTYFGGEGKTIPRVGMVLEVLQYTTEQNEGKDGKVYDNHTVKKLQTGVSTTQPVKVAQKSAESPRTAPVIRKDTKGTFIGFSGVLKAAAMGLKHENAEKMFLDAVKLFEMVEEYVADYWTTDQHFKREIKHRGLTDEFIAFLRNRYEVKKLTEAQKLQTLQYFDRAVNSYHEAQEKQNEEIEQTVREDQALDEGNRDFERQMEAVPGPADVGFPPEADEEVCPW